MKTLQIVVLVASSACAVATDDDANPHDSTPGAVDTDTVGGDTDATVSDADAATLRFLREEEKLARDVYAQLDATWGTPAVFANIAQSEQRHMDTLGEHLTRLGIPDPVVDDTRGVFTDPTLAALYVALVDDGAASVEAALTVGATIEDLDLVDLADAITATADPDLAAAYADLACGSRNHLRAFTGQLAQRGLTYAPQHLDPATYDAVVAGAHEACGG